MTDLTNEREVIDTSKDGVVIINFIDGVPGGRSLDVTDHKGSVIHAGHVAIREIATGKAKPMLTTGDAYAELPDGYEYYGVVSSTRLTAKPMCPIMYRGTVNQVASPYPVTEAIKTALKHIIFTQD